MSVQEKLAQPNHFFGCDFLAARTSRSGLFLNLMLFLSLVSWVCTLFYAVHADISLARPGISSSFSGSSGTVSIVVQWIESGSTPTLDDVDTYTFTLITGPNGDQEAVGTLEKQIPALSITDFTHTVEFSSSLCGNGLFYIQVYANLLKGAGHSTKYTNRFTLTGMTGTTVGSGSGSPPLGEVSLAADSKETPAAGGDTSASFTVPYTLQTGSTRYAPMQLQPKATVTATTWSRRFPTSAVSYFTTKMTAPVVASTLTLPWSYTINSQFNYAAPAPDPSIAGWYAASERLKSATIAAKDEPKAKRNQWVDDV